jgi:excisionase family DNA binding protein
MSDLTGVLEIHHGERWLTVKEYAARYRLHVQTVYSAIRYDRMPHPVQRFGRTIRIDVSRENIKPA